MKIAIIPYIYNNTFTYFENICASSLHDMGHDVCVFTTRHNTLTDSEMTELDKASPWKVIRSKYVLKIRETQIPYRNDVAKEIASFDPDVAFLSAPLGGPGYFWMKYLPEHCKVISTFSDIPLHRNKWFNFWAVKKRWFRSVAKRSQAIIAATPQSESLLCEWGDEGIKSKIHLMGLPFHFDSLYSGDSTIPELRAFIEGYPQIGSVVTRVIPSKNMPDLLAQIILFLNENSQFGFIIAGLTDNDDSQIMRDLVAKSECKDQILLLNQVSSGVVGEIFRSSKFSLWNGVSIGLYHSLSSGCPAVIWSKRGSAEHLIKHKLNGFWYDEYAQIPAVLADVATHSWDRERIKDSVKHANSPTYFQSALDLVCAKNFQSASK